MTRFSTATQLRELPATSGGVRSVTRALSLLRVMATSERSEWSLFELCQATNLPKATAHRLLSTMLDDGFVEHAVTPGYYRLGLEAAIVGHASLERRKPELPVHRVLLGLSTRLRETAGIGVLSGTNAIAIARTHPSSPGRVDFARGAVFPAHMSCGGKVLLAALPHEEVVALYGGRRRLERYTSNTIGTVSELMRELEAVREQGYAIDDEEYVAGVRCLGVPIPSSLGPSRYNVGISAPAVRASLQQLRIASRILETAARELSVWFDAGMRPDLTA
ncbi:IclR family transcriptional regulator [Conexibacter woesei]|uniref:Glycerol operon regulatory protein n=1 Tax=Conexibacter woesei (strain DSM 14684 / CCUG 47730 / CIP 108061 / JCM 11494 / NBRC 100937 / ID131577) TaxID=469383 RepID=D3FAP4_CONWI|nr:IclR family transcriptional regulator [Conexibacter woesei]ADB51207.1 transcriptional regulator, IclR family [Conexibacter woesei DSM 14684]